ncbi:apolipoprotein L3-like isoform X2 [Ailuropoda melanoleuca]|uniref:apolipoprotein L3-like isoform X2 n=1 Tax=Ailuropoda melanoleuca TaxID=9646 RepID=UPI001494488B|nr:apolipoprotein L3-like isoform X2 [Ailuropoda melanoleuca]
MTSGAHGISPESEALVEKAIEFFQSTVSLEELHILLTNHETWERFVAEATLSREEADAVRESLDRLDMEAEDQLARERFLSEFPQLKMELEERIRKLLEVAGICVQDLGNISTNVRAIKLANINGRCLMKPTKASAQGTALSLTNGSQIMGMAISGISCRMDMLNFEKNSGHLQEGAKTESAEEMRREAQELESKLEELTKIYESLTEGPTP